MAEESEIQDSNLPDSARFVRVQESAAWEETRSGKPRPLRPSKQAKKYRKKQQKAQNQQAAGQEDSSKQKHWRELRQLLEQDGRQPMISQEEQLVSRAEKYESQIPEKTLGRWVIEHILTLLARGEDDAPAIKVAVEQTLASPEEPTGMMELKILQANITSYRTEIRRWVTEQPVHVTCLQETHIVPSKDQEVKASWNSLAKQISAVPAAVTQGEVKQGSQGGLMMVSANHINLRQVDSWASAGKGYQLGVLRLKGFDLCVGNVYLESGVGPTQGENPESLTRLATVMQAVGVPYLITGDWNCQPDELSSVMFPDRVGGRVLFPPEPTISTGGTLDFAV